MADNIISYPDREPTEVEREHYKHIALAIAKMWAEFQQAAANPVIAQPGEQAPDL
jgi:hypothetical protein